MSNNNNSASMASKTSKDVEVHVCRFIDYKPSAICAAHLNSDNKHCAIGRENGNIEIWDLNGSFIERIIPGKGANTIQSLLWIDNNLNKRNNKLRLISSGLDGWLNEWNLESLSIHSKISCHGYAIWNIAQSSIKQINSYHNMISAACDDGKLRIYRLNKDEFMFQCEFITSGRCLSTVWSKKVYNDNRESIIVYGGTSNGLIFGYDIITRQQIVNIVVLPAAVGGVRKKSAIKPLVWSLCSLYGGHNDKTKIPQIACSTSRGSIDIFDAEFGTLIQSYNACKNDIFSLEYIYEYDGDNTMESSINLIDLLIAGCVDGRVIQLTRRNHKYHTNIMMDTDNINDDNNYIETVSKQTEFVMTGYHRYHTHDVNVVSITNRFVISGGIDTQLISCSTRDFWTHYVCSPLSNSTSSNIIQIANNVKWIKHVLPIQDMDDKQNKKNVIKHVNKLNEKLFLYQKDRTLELWYIYGDRSKGYNDNIHPIKVMDINIGFNIYNILCSSISNDGEWLCVANNQCIKLWKIKIIEKSVKLIKIFQTIKRGSTTINFSRNNKYLFITPNVLNKISNDDDDIDDNKSNDIGQYLDEYQDKNTNIIRINLENEDNVKIDKLIKIKCIGNYMISSLKLNCDSSLCSIIVPSLLYGGIIHIDFGKIFYEIPRGINNNNISCIEFQKNINEKTKKEEELLYVIYANNAIKMFYYDYYLNTNKLFKSKNNLRLHLWCSSNNKIWNIYNKNNPFSFTKILFNPSTLNKALLLRAEYMFSLVINRKLPDTHFAGIGTKRTFAMTQNDNINDKNKRMRIDQLIPSPFGKPQGGIINKDKKQKKNNKLSFLRVIRKYDPIIHAQFIDNNTLLIVHAPWHKVSSSFKRPLYRKKYAI